MEEKIIKNDELAKIIKLNPRTLRDYLTNYRFTNFITHVMYDSRKRLAYKITPQFANEMTRMLSLRGKWDSVKLWGNYCLKYRLNILDEEK